MNPRRKAARPYKGLYAIRKKGGSRGYLASKRKGQTDPTYLRGRLRSQAAYRNLDQNAPEGSGGMIPPADPPSGGNKIISF